MGNVSSLCLISLDPSAPVILRSSQASTRTLLGPRFALHRYGTFDRWREQSFRSAVEHRQRCGYRNLAGQGRERGMGAKDASDPVVGQGSLLPSLYLFSLDQEF